MAADALATLVLAGAGVTAAGVAGWWLLGKDKTVVKARIEVDELRYVCEGQRSIICAYSGGKPEWAGMLVQLRKEPSPSETSATDAGDVGGFLRRIKIQRALAEHGFRKQVDQAQIVALPAAVVRAVDAQLVTSRPHQDRQRKLATAEAPGFPGRVLALRQANLMEAPLSAAGGRAPPPLLSVELRLGCGLRELGPGLPSRHALAGQALRGELWNERQLAAREPLPLFSGDKARVAAALRERMDMRNGDDLRVFVDGRPVHPAMLPLAGARKAGAAAGLAAELAGCPMGSLEELAAAVAGALAQRSGGPLLALQRLQCFAAGESEKLAERLLEDLARHLGGAEAAAEALRSTAAATDAIAKGARGREGLRGIQDHEREGRRLIGLASWGAADVDAAKRWLALFLLGRAAFEAKLLVSFVRPELSGQGAEAASEARKQLRRMRFVPLEDVASGLPVGPGVWVCVTIIGLELPDPTEIPACAAELESLTRRFRELQASADAAAATSAGGGK